MQDSIRMLCWLVLSLLIVWWGYAVAAVFHEVGHAMAGMLSGGSVYMLRLGSCLWLSGGGWYVVKQKGLCPAQCLVVCKSCRGFCITAAGGCAANLFTGSLAFIMLAGSGGWNMWNGVLLGFGSISALMAGVNWCKGLGRNDGRMYRQVRNDARKSEEYCRQQRQAVFCLEYGLVEEVFV